jgi:hypothetical protein
MRWVWATQPLCHHLYLSHVDRDAAYCPAVALLVAEGVKPQEIRHALMDVAGFGTGWQRLFRSFENVWDVYGIEDAETLRVIVQITDHPGLPVSDRYRDLAEAVSQALAGR